MDDNPVNQKVMVQTLTKLGCKNIEVASDGKSWWSFLTGVRKHDLEILDISMPVLDGVAATQEIRATGSAVPTHASPSQVRSPPSIFAPLPFPFLAKPFDQ